MTNQMHSKLNGVSHNLVGKDHSWQLQHHWYPPRMVPRPVEHNTPRINREDRFVDIKKHDIYIFKNKNVDFLTSTSESEHWKTCCMGVRSAHTGRPRSVSSCSEPSHHC